MLISYEIDIFTLY